MFAVATITLVAGMVDDMRSQKVHNVLVLALFAAVLACNFVFRDFSGLMVGVGAMVLAILATGPLFALKILGGGDVKLFSVFALSVDPVTMFWTLIYSFIWGGFFGLTRASLQGRLFVVVRNTYKTARRQKVQPEELQKIPYTFALLLGWATQFTLMRAGLS